jgi:hypothetical protein
MFETAGDIFLCAAIVGAILFMLVLGYVSIEESVRGRRSGRP